MRGLLFTGGSRPNMGLATPFFGNYDVVYAADSGVNGAQEAGLEISFLVGDMDSIPDPKVLELFKSKQVIRAPRDKDLSDTELALTLMRKQGVTEIVLIGGDGGRMDHFFAVYRAFSHEKPPVMWIGTDTIAIVLEANTKQNSIQVNNLNYESTVSIFPITVTNTQGLSDEHSCIATGLQWPVNNLLWDSGEFSLSNRAPSGNCTIEAVSGRFFVILPLIGGYSLS